MESQKEVRRKKTYVYVYVIGAVGLTAVKIGTTRDPAERLRIMQCGSPVRLAIEWVYEWWSITGGQALEGALHDKFAEHRLHGEWFDLGLDPVPAVRAAVAELISLGLPPELKVKPLTRMYNRSAIEPDDEEALRVLQDLAEIFTETGSQILFTSDLTEALQIRGEPYAEMTTRRLTHLIARSLGPSQVMTVGSRRARGYHVHRAVTRWEKAQAVMTDISERAER